MKKTILISVTALSLAATTTYHLFQRPSESKVLETQSTEASVKDDLLGYTKYTDYIAASKLALTGQSKFLAANVAREYDLVEHLQVGRFGLTSNATVLVHYRVDYAFGIELMPGNFDIAAGPAGLVVTLKGPTLVAPPAVTPLRYEILDRGMWTHEKTAVIAIHQRLPGIAQNAGMAMAHEEAIRALCEKQLVEFLRDFLGKQQGVKVVPAITVVYK